MTSPAPIAYRIQGSYPASTVTVYLAGSTTLATIYADNSSTPKANPFVADTDGQWFFYAANGRYDVRFSGNGLAAPFTLGAVQAFDGVALSGSSGSSLVGFLQAGVGAVPRTVQDKLREHISVVDFGADPTGVADSTAAIQTAHDSLPSTGGTILFPSGAYKLTGAVVISKMGVQLVGIPRSSRINKSGAGAFFNVTAGTSTSPVQGFTAQNLMLYGDLTAGAFGFHFTGQDVGVGYQVGPTMAIIQNCFFYYVGNNALYDETAGGAVFVEAETQTFKMDHNVAISCGYMLRHTVAADNAQVRHNLTADSRSMAVQVFNIPGSGVYEISNNNLANVGGGVFLFNAAHINMFGNEFLAGEAGPIPGPVVKRNYESTTGSLAFDAAGASAMVAVHSCLALKIHDNTVSLGLTGQSGPVTGDYGIYLSNFQGYGQVHNNGIFGYSLAGIRVTPQNASFVDNILYSNVPGSVPYFSASGNQYHPGIIHFGWDGISTNYWSFGTALTSAPFELVVPGSAFPQFKVSRIDVPSYWLGLRIDPVWLAATMIGFNGTFLFDDTVDTIDAAKQVLIGLRHYLGATEEPFYWTIPVTTATDNFLQFGGGSGSGNAATEILFYTALNNTTTAGNLRLKITKEGYIVPVGMPTSPVGLPAGALWNDAGTVKLA